MHTHTHTHTHKYAHTHVHTALYRHALRKQKQSRRQRRRSASDWQRLGVPVRLPLRLSWRPGATERPAVRDQLCKRDKHTHLITHI
jgi:hypothetical protein